MMGVCDKPNTVVSLMRCSLLQAAYGAQRALLGGLQEPQQESPPAQTQPQPQPGA